MKADAWDGGHRIPYIARWPNRIKAGTTSDALTSLTHLFATVADILEAEVLREEAVDSYSLLPVLLGEASQVEGQPAIVHHSSRGFFAIRKGDWKLIQGRGSGGFSEPKIIQPVAGEPQGQLYDIANDIAETNDLYSENTFKVKELSDLLERIKMREGGVGQ